MDTIKLDNTQIPLHYQIADYILTLLNRGELDPAEQLPTEEKLRAVFGVSRTTIRKAMEHLLSKGLLYRKQGRGTFWTAAAQMIKREKLSGINRQIFNIKKGTTVKVLSKCRVKGSLEVTTFLNLPPQSEVILFERLRYDDQEPVSYTINYLPLSIGTEISQSHLQKMTMLETLEKVVMVNLGTIEHQVEITRSGQVTSKYLRIPVLDPMLTVNTRVFDARGVPIEIVWTHFVEQRYRFRVILDN